MSFEECQELYSKFGLSQANLENGMNTVTVASLEQAAAQGNANAAQLEGAVSSAGLTSAYKKQAAQTALLNIKMAALNAIFMLVVGGITHYLAQQERAIDQANELARAFDDESKSLSDQVDKYKELGKQLQDHTLATKDVASIKEELLGIQNSLIDSYGDEIDGLNLVNGKYEEQLVLLDKVTKAQAKEHMSSNQNAYDKASKKLNKNKDYRIGEVFKYSNAEQSRDQQLIQEFLGSYAGALLTEDTSYSTQTGDFTTRVVLRVNADVKDAEETLQKLWDDLFEFGAENGIDVSDITSQISKQISNLQGDEELQKNKNIYDNYNKAAIMASDILRPLYGETIDAIEAYNDALSSGENVEEARANLDKVKASVEAVQDTVVGASDVFEDLYDTISPDAELLYNIEKSLQEDRTAQGLAETLRGMYTADVKGMRFDDGLTEQEENFKSLINYLGVTYDDMDLVISKLQTLGYLIGDVVEPPAYTLSDVFNLDDTDLGKISESIDKIQNAYTTLNDAINEYNKVGYLSVDTIQDVVALGSGYLDYLVDEEGNLRLDKAALQQLTIARLKDMQAQALQELVSQVENIKDETDANKFAAQSYREKAESISMVTAEFLKYKIALLDISDQEKKNVLNTATKQMKQINALFDNAIAGVSKDPVNAIGGSKSTSESKETFDWIETALSRIQRTITNLGKVVSGTYRKWSTRNSALAQEIQAVNQEISLQQSAYESYMAKAGSVGLSSHYQDLVMNGGMDISEITDDTLKEQIKDFQTYYEKALAASDSIEDLRANLAELAKTKFDNLSAQYNAEISMIEHYTSMLDGYISQSEAAGYMASKVYYEALSSKQNENIDKLQDEYSTLLSAFDEAVQSGAIEKYSEDWYDMLTNINDVEQALQDANTALIEYNQTMQQLSWDAFDRIQEYTNNINDEASFLIDILDAYDSHTDNGKITDEGLAIQGLHAVNYNVYMEQAAAYADELAKIEKEMASDPYDMQLIDRRNELLGLQQDAISNAMSEKEAIADLVSNGYDKMLNSLQELIDKRKEALQAEKDLYQYQKEIDEKTSNIASYKKQLEAYKNDNSEEAKATIQKLELSLKDAEQDLEETEYNKYLSDQEAMLDDLYNQTELWINQRLDNIDGLVAEAVAATNKNASTISGAIHSASSAFGYQLSDKMEDIWGRNDSSFNGLKNIVGIYGDVLYGIMHTVDGDINTARDTLVQHIGNSDIVIGARIDENGKIVSTTMGNGMALINGNFAGIADTNKLINSSILNGTTTVCNALAGIKDAMSSMIKDLDKAAEKNTQSISSSQNKVVEKQPSNNITTNVAVSNTSTNGNTTTKVSATVNQDNKKTTTTKTNSIGAGGSGGRGSISPNKNVNMYYASGTTNARKGLNVISEAGDEIVLDNYGNAVLAQGMQLYPFEGGETVLNAKDTADVLKSTLTPLNEQAIIGGLARKSSSGVGTLSKSAASVNNDIDMNITLPNVTDYDSFITNLKTDKRFERLVQTMTVGSIAGKNSLSKNKL